MKKLDSFKLNNKIAGVKLSLLIMAVFLYLFTTNTFAQAIVNPVEGTQYYIKNVSSGNYLENSDANWAVHRAFNESRIERQKFTFELVSGYTYKIKNVNTGFYMYRNTNGWDVNFDAATSSNWILESYNGKTIIKRDGSNHLGIDASGEGVYFNKGWSTSTRLQWEIIDATVLDKLPLENAITDATILLNAAEVGTTQGKYPQADYTLFSNAITTAQNALNTATSQGILNTSLSTLLADIETFKTKMVQFIPEIGKYYLIKYKSTELALTSKIDMYAEINTVNSNDLLQRIKFESVPSASGKYFILNGNDVYLTQSSGNNYDLTWGAANDLTYNGISFSIETINETDVRIKSTKSLYIGSDYDSNGFSQVYADKNNSFFWKIISAPDITTRANQYNSEDYNLVVSGQTVRISNLKNTDIAIHNIDGKLICKLNSFSGSYAKELKNGIYIISINDKKSKFGIY